MRHRYTCFGNALHSATRLRDSKLLGERAFTYMLHGSVTESGMSNCTSVQGVQLKVVVMAQSGLQLAFQIRSTTPLRKVFQAVCLQQGVSRAECNFCFAGERLSDDWTAESSGLESGDVIDYMVYQLGD